MGPCTANDRAVSCGLITGCGLHMRGVVCDSWLGSRCRLPAGRHLGALPIWKQNRTLRASSIGAIIVRMLRGGQCIKIFHVCTVEKGKHTNIRGMESSQQL